MTTTPETPALPGDLTDETIERAAAALHDHQWKSSSWHPKWGEGGHCLTNSGHRHEALATARAVLAAARVAPAAPSERPADRPCPHMPKGETRRAGECYRCAVESSWVVVSAPAPSPDRETMIAEAASDAAARTFMDGNPFSHVEDAWENGFSEGAALAVPPVVNEAKLAEIIDEHYPEFDQTAVYEGCHGYDFEGGEEEHAEYVATVLVERQREWLETGR